MAKIPFDIKWKPQIESGEYKVETEAGSPAKVMDWEYNSRVCGKCIAIKITEGDGDQGLLYTHEGKRASIFPAEEGSDLFIITTEPEFTEFEKKLWEIMKAEGAPIGLLEKFTEDDKRVSHLYATELLELARKELSRQGNIVLSVDDFEKRHIEAQEVGRKEALKDLPRWKKDESFETEGTFMGVKGRECFVVKDGYSISVAELIKKLPGFKKD